MRLSAWREPSSRPPCVPAAEAAAAQAMDRPAVTVRTVQAGAAAGQVPSSFVLSSPGMMVNFILFSLMTAGIALIIERRNGTLRRLMTTRVRRSELIAGKVAGMFAVTFVQQIILIGVGQLVVRRRLPARPAGAAAHDGLAVARRLEPRAAARLGAHQRAGAHRHRRDRVDERLGPLGRLVPARDHRARPSGSSATCCRRRGSSTRCAASSCAASTCGTCCRRSASRWPGPPACSAWPCRASG